MPLAIVGLTAAALLAALAAPCLAQETAPDKPAETPAQRAIRNAPSARALELAAYVFSAANVCGFQIGVPEFDALLATQNVKAEDVSPRGPFGNRIQGIFALMSNDMAKHREESCIAVIGEYGPDGSVAKNVLKPAPDKAPDTAPGKAPDAKP